MEAADLSVKQADRRLEQSIRAAELVGALSLATDLGTGQPLEHALRTAVLAVRLGELAGASDAELADTYYVALLHGSGCTSNSHEATQLFGEDIMHRAAFFLIDPADPEQVLAFYRTHVGPGRPTEVRERMIEAALSNPTRARESFAAMCEVAQRFARWLELGAGVEAALEYVFARWDGKGPPGGVGGEALPLPARLRHVARDYSLFLSAADADDARTVLERRAGVAYDPHLAERAFAQSQVLAPIGRLAGSHHERLDGSGYQRPARIGTRSDRAYPRRRRLLHGDASGEAVPAGARAGGCRGGAKAGGRGG